MKICYFCEKEAFYGAMCKKCLKEMEQELNGNKNNNNH